MIGLVQQPATSKATTLKTPFNPFELFRGLELVLEILDIRQIYNFSESLE